MPAADMKVEGTSSYRLVPGVEVFPAPDGDVYLLGAGGGDAVVRDPDPVDRTILTLLAEREVVGEAELAAATDGAPRELVRGKLAALCAAGAVVEERPQHPLAGDNEERFSRQLPFFADSGDPRACQQRLLDARVVIVGCGGLGTWTLTALASAGVGAFTLVDDDCVDLSNLNRQVTYAVSDLGRPKVDCAARWLERFNPEARVETFRQRIGAADDLLPMLGEADALVLAADWPLDELPRWANAACLAQRVPWISMGQQPPLLRVGPTYLPWEGPCFQCQEDELRRRSEWYDAVTASRVADHRPATTLGPASGLAGTLAAMELVNLLARGENNATTGKALMINIRTLETEWDEIPRNPDCPACGSVSSGVPESAAHAD